MLFCCIFDTGTHKTAVKCVLVCWGVIPKGMVATFIPSGLRLGPWRGHPGRLVSLFENMIGVLSSELFQPKPAKYNGCSRDQRETRRPSRAVRTARGTP